MGWYARPEASRVRLLTLCVGEGREDREVDLWTAMLTTVRRWYVTIPIVVLAVVASIQLGERIDSDWEATASALLVAPTPPVDEFGRSRSSTNPLLANGNNVGTAADAVFRILDRDDHRREFAQLGLSEDYQIFRPTNSPLMDFFVVGRSERQALDTISALLRSAEVQLSIIQQQLDAQPDQLISTQAFERSREATESTGARLRFQVVVVLLGLVAATAAAILTESILARQIAQTGRRSESAESGSDAPRFGPRRGPRQLPSGTDDSAHDPDNNGEVPAVELTAAPPETEDRESAPETEPPHPEPPAEIEASTDTAPTESTNTATDDTTESTPSTQPPRSKAANRSRGKQGSASRSGAGRSSSAKGSAKGSAKKGTTPTNTRLGKSATTPAKPKNAATKATKTSATKKVTPTTSSSKTRVSRGANKSKPGAQTKRDSETNQSAKDTKPSSGRDEE